MTYKNSEAAYQAQKALYPQDYVKFTDLTAAQAKALGRKIKLRLGWDNLKEEVMCNVVRAKFEQNNDLKAKLLATGNALLVEGNDWGDRYWGVDQKTGEGENRLGKILMKVREEFRKESGIIR